MKGLLKKRDQLKTRRLEKGFTQEQLAKAVGVSKETIKSLEYGCVNPIFNLLLRICNTLESKAEDIF